MKKFLVILGIVVAVLLILGYIFRGALQVGVGLYMMQPDAGFAETTPPQQPDYTLASNWAALPNRDDVADRIPIANTAALQSAASVDVFYVHPTTLLGGAGWNQALDDEEINQRTDYSTIMGQASAFNACCRVYAPRYRQATLLSFFSPQGDGGDALELAYGDVVQAFRFYIDHYNDGRPFILAGHSQGGFHLDKLLGDEIAGTPLQDKLVAAYPIGYYIDDSNGIPVCQSAEQTGCQATWNTLSLEARSGGPADSICVNPLNWSANDQHAGFEENLGSVSFRGNQGTEGNYPDVELGVVDAQCRDGALRISEIRSENFDGYFITEGNYHIYDYSFFYMNIRQNAVARSNAYLAKK